MTFFFIFGEQQKTRGKLDQFGAMTFFFVFLFGDQRKTQRKVDQPKNVGPPKTTFAPFKTAF